MHQFGSLHKVVVMVSGNNGAENNGKAGKNNTFPIVVFELGVGCLDWGLGLEMRV